MLTHSDCKDKLSRTRVFPIIYGPRSTPLSKTATKHIEEGSLLSFYQSLPLSMMSFTTDGFKLISIDETMIVHYLHIHFDYAYKDEEVYL